MKYQLGDKVHRACMPPNGLTDEYITITEEILLGFAEDNNTLFMDYLYDLIQKRTLDTK